MLFSLKLLHQNPTTTIIQNKSQWMSTNQQFPTSPAPFERTFLLPGWTSRIPSQVCKQVVPHKHRRHIQQISLSISSFYHSPYKERNARVQSDKFSANRVHRRSSTYPWTEKIPFRVISLLIAFLDKFPSPASMSTVDGAMISSLTSAKKMQGYKVTDNKRSRKFGIAANSLKMLTERAGTKFNVNNSFHCSVYSLFSSCKKASLSLVRKGLPRVDERLNGW